MQITKLQDMQLRRAYREDTKSIDLETLIYNTIIKMSFPIKIEVRMICKMQGEVCLWSLGQQFW